MGLVMELGSEGALHGRIADALRQRIRNGELVVGQRLPTSRSLAKDLDVSRTTVVRAYEQLAREGWVEGRVGQGTVVLDRTSGVHAGGTAINWDLLLTARTCVPESEFDDLLQLLSRPGLISFAGGLPAPEQFPMASLQQVTADVLENEEPSLLQWCPVEGYAPLRSWVADRVRRQMDEVLILTGSTQGIHLLCQAFLNPGDCVVAEAPTYPGALTAFRCAGARVITVPSGARGIDVDALGSVLQTVRPKLVYVVPTFQNPTGGSMPQASRSRLLDLIREHGVPLVEDDPYSLLRYEGPAIPHLIEEDRSGYVIHLSTFSKMLTPGLRVGWLVADSGLVRRLSATRNLIDLFVNSLAQASLYRFCQRGLLDYHVRHVRPIYLERRDAMAAALNRYCPDLHFELPSGGLFIWASLPHAVTARHLLRQAAALGVGFAIGDLFYPDRGGEHAIRLCFATHPPETIQQGIRKLGAALERCRAETPKEDVAAAQGFIV
jgi:2-aminoadipate transaminase